MYFTLENNASIFWQKRHCKLNKGELWWHGSQKAIFCQKLWEHNCMIYCLPVPWYSVLLGVSKFSKRTASRACFTKNIHLGSDDGNIGHLHFLIKAFEICISVLYGTFFISFMCVSTTLEQTAPKCVVDVCIP